MLYNLIHQCTNLRSITRLDYFGQFVQHGRSDWFVQYSHSIYL